MTDASGKALRVIAIVLMGLTAAMNVLGGVGTVCAAFLTESFPSMRPLLEYRWLYQLLMILTILTGIAGAWLTMRLIKSAAGSYRLSLALLLVGKFFAAVQVVASLALRGKAVPANMKLYANALTLIVFLLIKLPGIWQRVGLEDRGAPERAGTAAGMAAIAAGLLVLTTSLWVGSSHIYEGNNWVHVLRSPLLVSGSVLLLLGTMGLALSRGQSVWPRVPEAEAIG
ncbi:MAG TPA: hypothetical protein VFI11_05440 [Anaerolineales bacterium]|nr:hypothetical protein [Anaerolineales bacterium]